MVTGTRRIVLWMAGTVVALVLLFGYHTSTSGVLASSETAVVSTPVAGTAQAASSTGGSTYTGDVAQTRWGPVQVAVTVTGGQITSVAVVQYPSGNPEDDRINSYALPILVDETVQAQSASIDMVSGATVTSDGYLQSLQSALDQAGS